MDTLIKINHTNQNLMETYQLTKVKNCFQDNSLTDVDRVCQRELMKLSGLIKNGASIAIGVGSRGICNLEIVVREVVDFVKSRGAHPFIIPAMGSHGGATAGGQEEVLSGYGITKKKMGSPIRSSMEAVEIPNKGGIHRIYMDKFAYESDGIILINRIKPHTDFHGKYESGLVKMAVIGIGKELGAEAIHYYGVHGLINLIPYTAEKVFGTGKILGGIGLIENAYDKTMMVQAIPGNEILKEELKLIDIARANMPKLPVDKIDALLIDWMGKDISGVGMDTNIIGRIKIPRQPEPESPKIKSIVVRDLTDESHGNVTGIGLADIITKKLFHKIDFEKTNKNIATSSFLERGKIPFIAENDREALELALRNCGHASPGKERIIRIKDTLHLDELYVSEAILREIKDNPQIEVTGESMPIFDNNNSLLPF